MIELSDLILAYRKAKVDLFYSSHPSLELIALYEENLYKNLLMLLEKINGLDETWVSSQNFYGEWTLSAKSISPASLLDNQEGYKSNLIFSSPSDNWKQFCETLATKENAEKPKAEFRVMAQCSLDFHVLSALWIIKVGHLFDSKLTSSAYGNRLRRKKSGNELNLLSLGSFLPYLKPFRDWRDTGIAAMQYALQNNKEIIAITADINSFYHNLNPKFMLDSDFYNKILNIELSSTQEKLNRLFVNGLHAWAANTPLKKGLPVGLPASAVVANVALLELDRIIERQIVPLHYGRYVDDIMLVMENTSNFRSPNEIWEWIFSRSGNILAWNNHQNNEIIYKPNYLDKPRQKSKIKFSNKKNKIFLLSGENGKALVNSIIHQIHERTSEWRAMPWLPHSSSQVGTDLLSATQNDGEAADNLRKTDALTMRRAVFAIKLRDLEAYERDLHPQAWQQHRHAFFQAFIQHVIVLPKFFDLEIYLPRVIKLAAACEDFAYIRKIINALEKLCLSVKKSCFAIIKACHPNTNLSQDEIILKWEKQVFSTIQESISAAIPTTLSQSGKQEWKNFMSEYHPSSVSGIFLNWPRSKKEFQTKQKKLFSCDLAHLPFRFLGLPKEMILQSSALSKKAITSWDHPEELLNSNIVSGVKILSRWTKLKGLPYGFIFSTRPFSIGEIFIINRENYTKKGIDLLRTVTLAIRGFSFNGSTPYFDKNGVLQVTNKETSLNYVIAVSSWQTDFNSWTAAVMNQPDPDTRRYARLNRLLNKIISESQESRYLIMPELSLPAHWFIRIARKLQGKGISLITGIEYLHTKKSKVRNQVWSSLLHDGLGFPSLMIYRQDKQNPALHEESELRRLNNLEMSPELKWKKPPIIQHGNLRFSILICSELTNIKYRSYLRGKIDALFVPEWNQDTETFNALVESAALDMHAYIIQCNDRQYGDSRIRAPFKENWKRDVLRVKGGIADYCVLGQINIESLRRFQSSYRSPEKPFKPVPDGFEISYARKTLPQ
ncbi:reverse transcriptase (RNA-dependent DNA polymerase) [Acetobacter aceti NBRC 14818]|nr:RNA-directed DNA polymerase [Acetobacter aceti]TCS33564.1 reverse transcriptase (RNA-dependent DNA polymerase) [Acetobacter aceti NBRC 14818]